jgi:hypothetical protein
MKFTQKEVAQIIKFKKEIKNEKILPTLGIKKIYPKIKNVNPTIDNLSKIEETIIGFDILNTLKSLHENKISLTQTQNDVTLKAVFFIENDEINYKLFSNKTNRELMKYMTFKENFDSVAKEKIRYLKSINKKFKKKIDFINELREISETFKLLGLKKSRLFDSINCYTEFQKIDKFDKGELKNFLISFKFPNIDNIEQYSDIKLNFIEKNITFNNK